MRPVVARRLVAELLDRQVGLHLALVEDAEAQIVRGPADDGEVEAPFAEDRLGLGLLLRPEHHQHALLALRQHHLVGGHAGFAAGHLVKIEFDAEVALGAHLDGRRGQPRGAHVLDRHDGAGRHQLEAGFQQQLLREGIADLDGRAFLVAVVVEDGRGHGSAVDAVAAGLGAEIDDRQADAGSLRVEDGVGPGDAGGKGVDQDVAVVAAVEADLAAHRGHAEGIAVAADAGDDAGDQMARLGMVRRAEAERIHRRDRPRAHGEDVAQDAADPGRRALIGLDIGGVVVALHLEDDRLAVADIDDAGVLAGAADDAGAAGRQEPQPGPGGLVRAVLVPHGREDAEFGDARLAADEREDALVFVRLQPVGGDEVGGDLDGGVHVHPVPPLAQRATSARMRGPLAPSASGP